MPAPSKKASGGAVHTARDEYGRMHVCLVLLFRSASPMAPGRPGRRVRPATIRIHPSGCALPNPPWTPTSSVSSTSFRRPLPPSAATRSTCRNASLLALKAPASRRSSRRVSHCLSPMRQQLTPPCPQHCRKRLPAARKRHRHTSPPCFAAHPHAPRSECQVDRRR